MGFGALLEPMLWPRLFLARKNKAQGSIFTISLQEDPEGTFRSRFPPYVSPRSVDDFLCSLSGNVLFIQLAVVLDGRASKSSLYFETRLAELLNLRIELRT